MDHASQLVDLVSEEGAVVATKTRREIRKGADLYHAVFVILRTPDRRMILSKIPSRKDLPNLYLETFGSTAATIRRHGETPDEAARRAVKNELCLENLMLHKIGEGYAVLSDGHRKYVSVYCGSHTLPGDYSRSDITSLHTFAIDELTELLEQDQKSFAPSFVLIWQKYKKGLLQI